MQLDADEVEGLVIDLTLLTRFPWVDVLDAVKHAAHRPAAFFLAEAETCPDKTMSGGLEVVFERAVTSPEEDPE